jgi:pyruvate carboxylase
VEHTITEATTGIDIVEAQILVAGGKSLQDLGIQQHNIARRSVAERERGRSVAERERGSA